MRVFENEEEQEDNWLANFVQRAMAEHGPKEPGADMADRIRSDAWGIAREKLQDRQITQDASSFIAPGDTARVPEQSDGDPSGGLALQNVTSADTVIDVGTIDTGSYGNKFNGTSDADGRVDACFTSSGEDLLLTFDGYDIDFNDEVEVLLNGVSLGFLNKGVNNGLSSYQFQITAAQQQAGDNVISFVQRGDVNWAWGVTNILLTEDQLDTASSLSLGITDTGSYGNKFNGTSDADGRVDACFTSSGEDLLLTFDGYDIDFNDEVEVLLNGVSLGFLNKGVNNGLSAYQFQITAAQQQAGDNVISFVQRGDVNWAWGVTNILLTEDQLDTASSLSLGITDTGSYGNKFNGTSDADGRVDASFTSTGRGPGADV